ncbi:hypothetical protein ABW19_dt0206645 [Dactylella cylindrospora]|nr:hypothetical protein ABW19_dt0206645 [Dactylella cylindrospora]
MESLEILDISRNKIRELPQDLGHLMKLKVLSISKNRIHALPNYISQMDELKILKVDSNPIIYPPPHVWQFDEEGDADKDLWLEELKRFLRQGLNQQGPSNDTEDSRSSDGENDTDYSGIGRYGLRNGKGEKGAMSGTTDDLSLARNLAPEDIGIGDPANAPAIPSKNLQRKLAGVIPQPATSSGNNAAAAASASQSSERSRSNSESVAVNRAAKRMGYIGQKNVLGTVDEVRTVKHHVRGISYDSSINEAAQRASNVPNGGEIAASLTNSANNTEDTNQPDPYFRRIQDSSKQTSRPDTGTASGIIETARSILYSIYKAQPTIEFYVGLIKERNSLPTTGIDRVLPTANLNISSLIQSLEACESKDFSNHVDVLINASHTAILTFKHVLNQLQQVVHDAANQIDARYTRTILLTIFGSLVELQNAWLTLRKYIPLLTASRPANSMVPGKTKPLNPTGLIPQVPQRVQEAGVAPNTPGAIVFDNPMENTDELLFDKLGNTVSVTLQAISLLSDSIKKTASQQNPHIQQSTLQKLRDLDKICNSGSEVAKRLKIRLETIREADWVERRRFYEDITRFVQVYTTHFHSL